MQVIKNPYISKVKIKNFRNFLETEVDLDHKQVIIGENNVGKTNFLRAIQLILDREFSDSDRQLSESDFHESLIEPMLSGEEIEIVLQVRGYEHNSKLKAQLDDACILLDPPTLQFKYKFFPNRGMEQEILNYKFEIFKGNADQVRFTSEDRSFINIYVIKALRDVERELRASKQSPLYKLVKQYEIAKDDLAAISEKLEDAASEILQLDEIQHIKDTIQRRFTTLSGIQTDNEVHLRTFDVDTERLLYTLQVYMGLKKRPISELSLGLANILYVSLMLILLRDRTVPIILKPERYSELLTLDTTDVLNNKYNLSDKGNYILDDGIDDTEMDTLYQFMDDHNIGVNQSFTILAVEEPEAHLHPVLQRLIYREVLHKSATSVLFTSHSTFIAAIAPLSSIVHVRRVDFSSKIYSTAKIDISNQEQQDIERYLDARRGEIYFGKGIILVEGITEEYFVPAAADLIGLNLDEVGIIVCNIDSTNFKPYIQLLDALHIPWILFTDGDYYEVESDDQAETGGEMVVKKFHIMPTGGDAHYLGIELMEKLLVSLKRIPFEDLKDEYGEQSKQLNAHGIFVGNFTLEVDIMKSSEQDGIDVIKDIYSTLTTGGARMKGNFDAHIDAGEYWEALKKIENNISKGRFAQRLASSLTTDMIPVHIDEGISFIYDLVTTAHE